MCNVSCLSIRFCAFDEFYFSNANKMRKRSSNIFLYFFQRVRQMTKLIKYLSTILFKEVSQTRLRRVAGLSSPGYKTGYWRPNSLLAEKMAKTVTLLMTAFLACSVFAAPAGVDEIRTKLQNVHDETITSISTFNLDNVERRRAIVSHSSEFAHKIQEAVTTIFKIFVRVDERYSHRMLPQVALRLNDVVHEVQEVLITKPSMLKHTLKGSINKVIGEAKKMIDVLEHFANSRDEANLRHDVENVVDKLIDAVRQLRVRGDVHRHSHTENTKIYRSVGREIVDTLKKINWCDRTTYEHLSKIVGGFDRALNHILHHFRDEIYHFGRKDFESVAQKLNEIRSQLGIVLHREYSDMNRQVEDLKTQLEVTVHSLDEQMKALANISDNGDVVVDNSIKNIFADCLHGEQRLLTKLQNIVRTHTV